MCIVETSLKNGNKIISFLISCPVFSGLGWPGEVTFNPEAQNHFSHPRGQIHSLSNSEPIFCGNMTQMKF